MTDSTFNISNRTSFLRGRKIAQLCAALFRRRQRSVRLANDWSEIPERILQDIGYAHGLDQPELGFGTQSASNSNEKSDS